MEPEVTKQSGPERFEITLDGRPAGFAQFVDHEGSRVFFHTEISPEFGGQGLAGVVVQQALEATREEGLRIIPVCPYVKKYVGEHDEWTEHVDRPTQEMLHAIPKDD